MRPGLTSESVDAETRSKLGAAMEASAQRTVRFLLPALAVFYFVLAPVHLAMVPPAHARKMATVAWVTSLVHRSATVKTKLSGAVADSGTVQALTSLAMAPKQRLNVLPAPVAAIRTSFPYRISGANRS